MKIYDDVHVPLDWRKGYLYIFSRVLLLEVVFVCCCKDVGYVLWVCHKCVNKCKCNVNV